ncbi:MAG: succinylglutamate desuccinylase/aspartoacylase family protein [Chloroflexi bacterium]|nr:succinylglutamate desuccinylase/aspartoacylase family protein [Chloroflexota bacterium]
MSPKQHEEILVTTLASGHRVVLPLHRITGQQPGPTLGITALVHGDEPLPNAVLRRVLSEVDPSQLKGTLLVMPVANPLAYEALSRQTPLDGINLNRTFPGLPNGCVTEQIAHAIVTQFLPQVQYLIDLHSGGVFPTVDYVYLSKLRPEMSHAFGSPLLYVGHGFKGTLSGIAEERNIPSLVVEIGGGSMMDDVYIDRGVCGVLNVMKHLNMLDGTPQVTVQQTVFKELIYLHPHVGGVLYPEVGLDQLGKVVSGGTLLGRILSPYTFEEMEIFKAPFARNYMILVRGAITRVNPGDFVYMCANADVA